MMALIAPPARPASERFRASTSCSTRKLVGAKIVAVIHAKYTTRTVADSRARTLLLAAAAVFLLACFPGSMPADEKEEKTAPLPPERDNPTVHLIKRVMPSIVALRNFQPGGPKGLVNFAAGSGAVIHPEGYILTNDHVIMAVAGNKDRPQGLALFADGSQYIFKILARLPAEDIAILKIETGKSLPFLSLGRSHDLVLGEPTLVIGNPNGLAHSVSTGIVSGLQRSTSTSTSYLPAVVQTTAPISGGSSGSPLINALGQIIGVITSQHDNGQNLNFAITIDHIRNRFPRLINAENLNGFLLGLEIDMLEPGAKITRVAPNSPAARENLQPGDLITGAGGRKITSGFEFHLALMNRAAGEELPISILRGKKSEAVLLKLAPLLSTIALEKPPGKPGGLGLDVYEGNWTHLPDFDKLKAAGNGRADSLSIPAGLAGKDYFGLRFRGFVRIPKDGIYTFYAGSDDGSSVLIGDRLLVQNDGLHAYSEASGTIKLEAGFYPFTANFFEASGEEKFAVSWEGPGIKKQALPAAALFTKKTTGKKNKAPVVPCQPSGE